MSYFLAMAADRRRLADSTAAAARPSDPPAMTFDASAASSRVAAAMDSIKKHEETLRALNLFLATGNGSTQSPQQQEPHLRPAAAARMPMHGNGPSQVSKPPSSSAAPPAWSTAAPPIVEGHVATYRGEIRWDSVERGSKL